MLSDVERLEVFSKILEGLSRLFNIFSVRLSIFSEGPEGLSEGFDIFSEGSEGLSEGFGIFSEELEGLSRLFNIFSVRLCMFFEVVSDAKELLRQTYGLDNETFLRPSVETFGLIYVLLYVPIPKHDNIPDQFTLRRFEVFRRYAMGWTKCEIGDDLNLTEGTVDGELRLVFLDLDANSIGEVVQKMWLDGELIAEHFEGIEKRWHLRKRKR